MKYNFDKVIDRSGTSAEKVEGLKHIWGRTDLIPLWVIPNSLFRVRILVIIVLAIFINPIMLKIARNV